MTAGGAAGRGPTARRTTPSRTARTRAAHPTRRASRSEDEQVDRQTTYTARAAILVLAVASVIVAVAVPLKIWVGQRSNVASLTAQTRQTERDLARLNAQDKKWQNPAYVQSQARTRLHYVLPGKPSHIVLAKSAHAVKAAAAKADAAKQESAASAPWFSEFWASDKGAGKPGKATTTK
jgi:cell division protein FtsB